MWHWLSHLIYPAYYRARKQNTIRYTFPFALVTALFIGLAAVSSGTGSYITVETDKNSFQKGDEVFVEVSAYAHVPINAVSIVIDYPERLMKFKGVDTGESVITLWTKEPYESGGKVYLQGGVFQKGFIGEHSIARIRMETLQSGMAYITLDSADLVAGDGKGTLVETERVAQNSIRVYVDDESGELTGGADIHVVTDVDGNGSVDLTDISTFMAAWFSRSKTFDFNGDGRMTFKDFSILLYDSFFK